MPISPRNDALLRPSCRDGWEGISAIVIIWFGWPKGQAPPEAHYAALDTGSNASSWAWPTNSSELPCSSFPKELLVTRWLVTIRFSCLVYSKARCCSRLFIWCGGEVEYSSDLGECTIITDESSIMIIIMIKRFTGHAAPMPYGPGWNPAECDHIIICLRVL